MLPVINESLLIPIQSHKDFRGELFVIDAVQSQLPFQVNRVFWITNVPNKEKRGNHAHSTCHEAIIALRGKFAIKLENGQSEKKFLMETPQFALHIPPMVWCELSDFSNDCICLCVASEPYKKSGYIDDYKEFLYKTKEW